MARLIEQEKHTIVGKNVDNGGPGWERERLFRSPVRGRLVVEGAVLGWV